jgi:hypothetical protein
MHEMAFTDVFRTLVAMTQINDAVLKDHVSGMGIYLRQIQFISFFPSLLLCLNSHNKIEPTLTDFETEY